ncbi:MAG: ATP phosphoribosyltransferase regulatory subunit, partial [Deinococcales bacterium]
MTGAPPDGTRFVPPELATARARTLDRLHELYRRWGYQLVEAPSLERYDPAHPRAEQSFKLSDRDSGVLALRSDFTPALAQLVRTTFPGSAAGEGRALRLRYAGTVWHAIHPELARTREFTQVGIELVGVSHARADAELIHLARESVRAVGLAPRVEIGNPGFVRALFDVAEVPEERREPLADAIDRKDRSDIRALLAELSLAGPVANALLEVPDLYG